MKRRDILRIAAGIAGWWGGVLGTSSGLEAAPFLYSPGDLVLVFRQSGNATDYVVNLGKAGQFAALAEGTRATIAAVSQEQLTLAFPSLNGLKWSVAGANRPPADPNYPLQTLWLTSPREEAGVVAKPWIRKGVFVQGNVGSQVDGVGVQAASSSSLQPGGPDNTATGVVIPVGAPFAIGPVIGLDGNYAGTFQGSVENVTADDFDADPSQVSRSDLYELEPGSTSAGTLNAPGKNLGYFELKPDGVLTFQRASAAIPRPEIQKIQRDGTVTQVTFSSVSGGRYRLRSVGGEGLGRPVASWETGATVVANGPLSTVQESSGESARFYAVEVQP